MSSTHTDTINNEIRRSDIEYYSRWFIIHSANGGSFGACKANISTGELADVVWQRFVGASQTNVCVFVRRALRGHSIWMGYCMRRLSMQSECYTCSPCVVCPVLLPYLCVHMHQYYGRFGKIVLAEYAQLARENAVCTLGWACVSECLWNKRANFPGFPAANVAAAVVVVVDGGVFVRVTQIRLCCGFFPLSLILMGIYSFRLLLVASAWTICSNFCFCSLPLALAVLAATAERRAHAEAPNASRGRHSQSDKGRHGEWPRSRTRTALLYKVNSSLITDAMLYIVTIHLVLYRVTQYTCSSLCTLCTAAMYSACIGIEHTVIWLYYSSSRFPLFSLCFVVRCLAFLFKLWTRARTHTQCSHFVAYAYETHISCEEEFQWIRCTEIAWQCHRDWFDSSVHIHTGTFHAPKIDGGTLCERDPFNWHECRARHFQARYAILCTRWPCCQCCVSHI